MNAARSLKTTVAALTVGAAALLVFASSALALSTHVFSTSFGTAGAGDGQLSSPLGVAVNSTSHDVYVADTGNARIEQFSSAGAFIRTFGTFTTPTFVAVDNSGGASEGDVYVGDTATNLVQKFDASGNLITSWGTSGQLDGSTATDGPFGALAGVTVDDSGNLWVYDQNSNMFEFAQDGTFNTDWNSGRGVIPSGIDADSAGNLYVLTGAGTVEQFSSTGTDVGPVNGDVSNPTGFAVDRSNDEVYMDNGGSQIYHYAASCDAGGSCTALDSFGSGNLSSAADLAVDPSNAKVFAADGGNNRVAVFSAVTLPDATTNAATAVGPVSATLNGHLDPAGGGDTTNCHFDYTDDASFQSNGFTGAQTVPCAEGNVHSSATDVHADVSGLNPETTYHFRLSVANSSGTNDASDLTFTTSQAVQLSTGSASDITKTTATLNGTVNPGGAPLSSCQFDYTDDATFQSQAYTGANTASCDQSLGAIGSGSSDVAVSAAVSGLQAGTPYHFRLKASNTFGASVGQDQTFPTTSAGFGFKSFSFKVLDQNGQPYTQAGGHPYKVEADAVFNTKADAAGHISPEELVKDYNVSLPPGLVGDPTAVPQCSAALLQSFAGSPGDNSNCPPASQLGVINVYVNGFGCDNCNGIDRVPVYNLTPQDGVAAQFGFVYLGYVTIIDSGVRSGSDYGIDSGSSNITTFVPVRRIDLRLWGVPADPSHTPERSCNGVGFDLAGHGGGCTSPAAPKPFFTNATSCTGPQTVTARTDPWQHQGNFVTTTDTLPANTGCNQVQFDPSLKARPTTNVADSPSGFSADVNMPQTNDPGQLGTAHLRKAVVTLPEGLVINPSSANGLGSCSASDVGLTSAVGDLPVTFTPDEAQCPDAAKLGTAEVDTPLLDHPITGSVYAAKPFDNPFGTLLAIYITASDKQSGVVVKLAGKVTPDPNTGQLVTTFDENPQQPVGDFKLDFFGGAGGALRTPAVCGDYSTTSEMTPWSAPDSGPPVTPHDDWSITQGPNGSCANSPGEEPHSPSFDAGTVSPVAGTYSPFVMHLRREDGSQQFASLTLTPPPGLLGKLAGTPACSEAQIAQAQNRDNPGDGATEKADPSCPASSQVGTVTVGAGAGPAPYYTTGKVYLAGPYKGSPLSFVIITPATAGPYDLGAVVVRAAIGLDPATAQITATSDPIPSILAGIPLDVRSITLTLDKPNFTLNGTSCDPSAVSGSLLSTLGQPASLSERFQLAECGNLGFKPKFTIGLKGGTLRNGHPAATITLNERSGDANLGKAQITLPPSMQLDQSHIKAPCTRPQFAADQCPAASIIGSVTATSPLVDYTLSGNVYLRTGDNPLPDVVLDLHGPASQPVRFDVVNKIDTVNARLRATSVGLPDAPVTKAVISLAGGSKGLLVNNTNLCKQTNRASILLEGQNGKTADSTPAVSVAGCRKAHKHHKHHKRHHQRHGAR